MAEYTPYGKSDPYRVRLPDGSVTRLQGAASGRISCAEPNVANVGKTRTGRTPYPRGPNLQNVSPPVDGVSRHVRFEIQRAFAAMIERQTSEHLKTFFATFPGVQASVFRDEVVIDLTHVEARCIAHVQERVDEGRSLGGAAFVAGVLKGRC